MSERGRAADIASASGPSRPYVLGVDVGGTFTDVVVGTADGRLETCKVMTTPDDPRRGVEDGVARILARCGIAPTEVARVVHGTTLATNVILERRGADIALVTTAGFADLLRLGRDYRADEDRFDLFFTTPTPPVDRRHTFVVTERVDAAGQVLRAPDPAQVAEVAALVAECAPSAVAICLLHSYANPDHEQLVAEACRATLPAGTYVITSAEVWPELGEQERAMTTVLCAYVGPLMAGYLAGLEERLAALGIECPVEIMESSGGVMTAALAARRPVHTVESGGAAGVMAAGFVGRLLGSDQVVSFDMGGTTAKTAIVRGGRPEVVHDFRVGSKGSFGSTRAGTGYPLKMPVVDLAEVGAGGGSVAWVDSGGSLQVGPHSSGAVPGPACYGGGGTEPTVTDANLVLGYLRPGELSGGVTLSLDLAEHALATVAGPLGLTTADAARLVHEVANANMAAAVRVVTVQRGIDPRGFTLVGFGGAGPMHAAELAAGFGISEVVIPRAAGVASAIGLVTSDLGVELVLSRLIEEEDAVPDALEALYVELERQATAELPGTGGPTTCTRSLDMRYRGQAHELSVPVPAGTLSAAAVADLSARFRARYADAYGIELDAPTQLVTLRVRVVREAHKLVLQPSENGVRRPATPSGERPVYFAGSPGFAPAGVYDWAHLSPGDHLDGPAIVEGDDTTVSVPPGCTAETDRWGNLVVRRPSATTGAAGS